MEVFTVISNDWDLIFEFTSRFSVSLTGDLLTQVNYNEKCTFRCLQGWSLKNRFDCIFFSYVSGRRRSSLTKQWIPARWGDKRWHWILPKVLSISSSSNVDCISMEIKQTFKSYHHQATGKSVAMKRRSHHLIVIIKFRLHKHGDKETF